MSIYGRFAEIYDEFMMEMPYDEFTAFTEDLAVKHGVSAESVLDICCGTGSALQHYARKGYDCTGVDASAGMLKVARSKSRLNGYDIAYHRMDMRALRIKRRFPLVTCMFDSINYLTRAGDIRKFLAGVFRVMETGGIFIFDMNTDYAFRKRWGNRSFSRRDITITSYIKCNYEVKTGFAAMDLNIIRESGRRFEYIQERHVEKAYPSGSMKRMLREAGYGSVEVYSDRSFAKPGASADRVWFAAVK